VKLAAVALARIIAFVETADLNPRGRVHFPDIVTALVERYGFLKFPQKPEEFDESKGVTFEEGKFGEISNLRIQLYTGAIVVETRSSTDDSEKILEDGLVWASQKLGLEYQTGMIKRRAPVSQLTFYSDAPLNALNPILTKLSQKLTARIPNFIGQSIAYETTGIVIGYDMLRTKLTPSNFTIERRADAPFSENKYFSTAPMPTDEHIALLQSFEADVLRSTARPELAD
jgi:hypothetical protein